MMVLGSPRLGVLALLLALQPRGGAFVVGRARPARRGGDVVAPQQAEEALAADAQVRAAGAGGNGTVLTWPAFVISRAKDTDRRETFSRLSSRSGLDFVWFDAVDKEAMNATELLEAGEISDDVQRRLAAIPAQYGTYACALSHIRLWQQLAQKPPGQAFVVFEDDSDVPPDFHARLREAMEAAPGDWDMLYLNHNRLVGSKVNGFWLRPSLQYPGPGRNALLNAYVVRPTGLAKMLAFEAPISNMNAIDDNMRRHFADFQAYFLTQREVRTYATDSVRTE